MDPESEYEREAYRVLKDSWMRYFLSPSKAFSALAQYHRTRYKLMEADLCVSLKLPASDRVKVAEIVRKWL